MAIGTALIGCIRTMAHKIAPLSFRRDRVWSKFGTRLADGASIEEWTSTAGFDFELKSTGVQYTPFPEDWPKGFRGRFVQYNSKTLAPLAITTTRHRTVQLRDVMKLFRQATEAYDCRLEFASVLQQGRKCFVLASTTREARILDDLHKQYLLLTITCDELPIICAELLTLRDACANTIREIIYKKNKSRAKSGYVMRFDVEHVITSLGSIDFDRSFKEHLRQLEKLICVSITAEEAKKFFAELLSPYKAEQFLANGHTIRGLDNMYQSYLYAIGACPGTLYGMLQGVTFYVDNVCKSRDKDATIWSLLFGKGAQMKDLAYKRLVNMAK